MKKALTDFDSQQDTLVDFFAVIGIDHHQLIKVIDELSQGSNKQGNDMALQRTSTMEGSAFKRNFVASQGVYRILEPSVLASFPKQNRGDFSFPRCIDDFFFRTKEKVYTAEQVSQFIAELDGEDLDNHYECLEILDNHGRARFVTTHLFFEDLADVQVHISKYQAS